MARIDREQLGELLSGYIDGELDPRERQIIERVLREDESARQLLADLQRTARAVSSLPRHAAPASILGDTQANLERSALLDDFPEPRGHHSRGRSSWTARLAMAAMLGLVLVTGWWFTTQQTRRGSTDETKLAQREFRESDNVKDGVRVGTEKSALERASRAKEVPTTSAPFSVPPKTALSDSGRGVGAAVATVEQQLADGVDPAAFRGQSFAAEPVRLQVIVRNGAERGAVASRIAGALSGQHLADLALPAGARDGTTGSEIRFYYQGKAGVNFDAPNEDQILVRASTQQIDQLLTELSQPNQPEEAVALVAGPITVHGVEKSRSVVQLLGDQRQAGAPRSEMERNDDLLFDTNDAIADADRTSVDNPTAPNGGLVGGLLKIVGIDPKLLSSRARPAAEPGDPSVESAAEVAFQNSRTVGPGQTSMADAEDRATSNGAGAKKKAAESAPDRAVGQPPASPPLVERRLRAAARSPRPSAEGEYRRSDGQSTADENVTVVVQIIEQPSPSTKPTSRKPVRSDRTKTAE